MNLYELSEAYQKVQIMIEEGQEGLEDTLESINDAIDVKADGYAKVMRNLEAQASVIKEEEKRLSERRRSLENNVKRLKQSLEDMMINNDKRRIKTDLFSFNIQKNPPSIKVTDEEMIPSKFYIEQKPKLNRKELLKELKENDILGVELTQGESLRIR